MKKFSSLLLFVAIGSIFCSGCARYTAASLSYPFAEGPALTNEAVVIQAKEFTRCDCKRYLDRDVLRKGYQPVQIYIQNNSRSAYLFSLSRVNLPCVPPEEVAQKVHTSTFARIASYGAAGLFLCPLFFIPATIDGFCSAEANEALDEDFLSKAARDQILPPYSHTNMLLFIPMENYSKTFSVTLLEESTRRPKNLIVSVQ